MTDVAAPYQGDNYSGRDVTLLDLVDRLLDKGVVLGGDIVLSIADVDLVYISLRALVASVDTAMGLGAEQP
jgi:hypothetical protein